MFTCGVLGHCRINFMNINGIKSVPVTAHVHQGKKWQYFLCITVILLLYTCQNICVYARTYPHMQSGTHTLMHRQHCNLIKHATVESLLVLVWHFHHTTFPAAFLCQPSVLASVVHRYKQGWFRPHRICVWLGACMNVLQQQSWYDVHLYMNVNYSSELSLCQSRQKNPKLLFLFSLITFFRCLCACIMRIFLTLETLKATFLDNCSTPCNLDGKTLMALIYSEKFEI